MAEETKAGGKSKLIANLERIPAADVARQQEQQPPTPPAKEE